MNPHLQFRRRSRNILTRQRAFHGNGKALPHPHLERAGKYLGQRGRGIVFAPHHKLGQGKQGIGGKKEPQGLIFNAGDAQTAVILKGLPHVVVQLALPGQPDDVPVGRDVDFLKGRLFFKQTGYGRHVFFRMCKE